MIPTCTVLRLESKSNGAHIGKTDLDLLICPYARLEDECIIRGWVLRTHCFLKRIKDSIDLVAHTPFTVRYGKGHTCYLPINARITSTYSNCRLIVRRKDISPIRIDSN